MHDGRAVLFAIAELLVYLHCSARTVLNVRGYNVFQDATERWLSVSMYSLCVWDRQL